MSYFLLSTVTRVCRCNGTWSPNPCQASISQAEQLVSVSCINVISSLHLLCIIQISEGKAEQGLKVLLELPPNSINNTQRLEVLRSAFNKQSEMGVTKSFVQVYSMLILIYSYLKLYYYYFTQTSIQVIDEIPTDEVLKSYTCIKSYYTFSHRASYTYRMSPILLIIVNSF